MQYYTSTINQYHTYRTANFHHKKLQGRISMLANVTIFTLLQNIVSQEKIGGILADFRQPPR